MEKRNQTRLAREMYKMEWEMQKIETKNNLDRMKKLGALFSRITVSEPLVLVASALAAGCIWVFIEIADEVFEGDTRQLDETILLALRNPENPADPLGPS
ncbi:MAG TPA: hypothetical protein VJ946_01020, partial [Bacteroidales bacterium]|nr:hypothetical protein [Bacteroidales bacterium]